MEALLLTCTAAAFAAVIVLLLAGTGLVGRRRPEDVTRIDTRF